MNIYVVLSKPFIHGKINKKNNPYRIISSLLSSQSSNRTTILFVLFFYLLVVCLSSFSDSVMMLNHYHCISGKILFQKQTTMMNKMNNNALHNVQRCYGTSLSFSRNTFVIPSRHRIITKKAMTITSVSPSRSTATNSSIMPHYSSWSSSSSLPSSLSTTISKQVITSITINSNCRRRIDYHHHHRMNTIRLYTVSNIMMMTEQIVRNATTFNETHLGRNGLHLLDGLDVYTVPAIQDGHPLAVYGIHSTEEILLTRSPILLLHGRTWSSVPVYHLLGGHHQQKSETKLESRSLMEALYAKGLQPYAMDFRGFGGTPQDPTGCVEPLRCVEDTQSVLQWIANRHGIINGNNDSVEKENNNNNYHHPHSRKTELPALLGWSQGALIAQLVAQRNDSYQYLSKLILYASIYDPLFRYPRDPLYRSTNGNKYSSDNQNQNNQNNNVTYNEYDSAIEDFTVEGTIPPEPAQLFAEAALICDPIKAKWKHTYQFNTLDPARVQLPCLVIAGDQDPYAPMHVQQDLFCQLGRDSDRTWSILSGCDHAVHLLDGRFRLINILVSFMNNDKRTLGS